MAWVTPLTAIERVEYRLVQSAGCGLAAEARTAEPSLSEGQGLSERQERELAVALDQALAYRMEDRAERPLTWVGHGLHEFGLVPGSGLVSEADRQMARAMMAGLDPRDGAVLVKPKLAAHPSSLVPAADYVEALRRAADSREVTVSGLTRSLTAVKRIGRMERGVHGDPAHLVPIQDLDMLAKATGVKLEDVYAPEVLEFARQYAEARVQVGIRGYEVALDLPKSFSVFYGLADTPLSQQMEELWAGVAMESVGALEEWAAYGMSGKSGDGHVATRVATSGLSGWIMWHSVARPVDEQTPDPHLHAHIELSNMVHGEDGKWYVPGNGGREYYRHIQALGALSQARMRHELAARFGFQFVRDPTTGAWEIAGIDRDLREVFSKRAGQTVAQLVKERRDPLTATTAQAKAAAAKSRQAKTGGEAGEPVALRRSWSEQSAAIGVDGKARMDSLVHPGYVEEGLSPEALGAEIFHSETGLTAHRKRIDRTDLLTAVGMASATAVASFEHAQDLVDAVLKLPVCPVVVLPRGPQTLTHNDRYTTPDILQAELSGLASARAGYAGDSAVLTEQKVELALATFARSRGFELSPEQREAAVRLMTSGHAVDALIGVAGSGKTVLMQVLAQAYGADGKTIQGASTAAVAAAGLQAETGIPSATIASWKRRIERGDGLAGVGVLVVEEAAMVDDRALALILEAARTSGTKVVMIGDPHQLKAVGVGGLFDAIHTQVAGLTLRENRRQRNPGDRRALELWREGNRDQALQGWARGGHVHAGEEPADTMASLIGEWERTRTAMYAAHGPGLMDVHEELGRLLILAATHADVQELNTAARQVRRDAGEIVGDDRTYRREDGTSIELAIGDHVWVRQNDYRTRGPHADPDAVDVLNGYRGRITDIRERDGAVRVEWRRLAPGGIHTIEAQWLSARYIGAGGLTHGTALTVASAQGMTCDVGLVYGMGLDANSFYAAMSRARDRTELYLPRVTLETDVDRIQWGPPTGEDHSRARALVAYGRTLTGGPDTLVATELGLVPAPIADQQQPGPGPDPSQQVAQELLRAQQLLRTQEFPQPAPQTRPAPQQEQRDPLAPTGPAAGQAADPRDQRPATRLASRLVGETDADHRARVQQEIPRWRDRPYGTQDRQDLEQMLTDAEAYRASLIERAERALTDAHAELLTARDDGGAHTVALHHRRQELQAAADAGARSRQLEAQLTQIRDADRNDWQEHARLAALKQRNPIYLLVVQKTTRGHLTAEIADVRERIDGRIIPSAQIEHQAHVARQQARHPHDPQVASARGQGHQADLRNDRQVIQDLRALADTWPQQIEIARNGDIAAAEARILAAQHTLDNPTQTDEKITAINAELAVRDSLSPWRADRETTQRAGRHRRQAEQERLAADRRREQARQEELHRPYNPEPPGPSHGWSR